MNFLNNLSLPLGRHSFFCVNHFDRNLAEHYLLTYLTEQSKWTEIIPWRNSGGSELRILCSHCPESGFDPWLGN